MLQLPSVIKPGPCATACLLHTSVLFYCANKYARYEDMSNQV